MKLKIGSWYLIKCKFISNRLYKDIDYEHVVRLLGDRYFYSFELTENIGFLHKGDGYKIYDDYYGDDNLSGRRGYCVYVEKSMCEFIKSLTKDEIMVELL